MSSFLPYDPDGHSSLIVDCSVDVPFQDDAQDDDDDGDDYDLPRILHFYAFGQGPLPY